MRVKSTKIFIVLFVFILLGVASASAQATRPTEFNIPFDFVLQGRSLPAGKYTVKRFDKTKPEILIMKNSDGRTRQIFFTHRVETVDYKAVPLLVFRRYGEDHILSEVWAAGERSGQQLPRSEPQDQKSNRPVVVLVEGARLKSR